MSGDELIQKAKEFLPRARAPYSDFRVAAALEDSDGVVHPGVNVENASLGLTLCAERVALFGAIAHGASRFRRMAIVADKAKDVFPCGACRQALLEQAPDLIVIVESPSGVTEEVPLKDLVPRPFLSYPRA